MTNAQSHKFLPHLSSRPVIVFQIFEFSVIIFNRIAGLNFHQVDHQPARKTNSNRVERFEHGTIVSQQSNFKLNAVIRPILYGFVISTIVCVSILTFFSCIQFLQWFGSHVHQYYVSLKPPRTIFDVVMFYSMFNKQIDPRQINRTS